MSVTEVKQALGSWSIRLRADTPREVLDAIAEFGHMAVLPGRVDVAQSGDNLLAAARYVGVVRKRSADDSGVTEVGGAGMAFWLGDEDDKGAVRLTAVSFTAQTFANTIRGLLPTSGSVTEGVLSAVSGSYTGTHQYESPRKSITYVTDTFGTTVNPVSWRVNGDGTLDAGLESALYVTTPSAILVRRPDAGRDMFVRGMAGSMSLARDVEDYTTAVVLLAEGDGAATVSASAGLVTPYRDIHGNLVVLTRLVSEFETDATNAPARAQLQLNRFTNPRYAVNLSTDEYDVKGSFAVGDTIWVFDPDIGFSDTNNEVAFRGNVLNPKALTVSEMTWPVADGWTVAYRDQTGTWFDCSDFYVAESGASNVVVGEFSRAINDSTSQPVGSRPIGDSSIPAVPVFGASSTSSYQSDNTGSGATFAQIQLTWTQPLNTDGSTVVDGDHYEIRFRPTGSVITTSYSATAVPWGVNAHLITGLMPGTSYDFQIQAVDGAVPPNRSGWSSVLAVVSSIDTVAPSAPAAPSVAASRIAIQVTHTLGKSSGGTYNLEVDLDRLEVHVGASASFTPSNSTLVGKLPATVANIRASIPAVGTFPVESTAAVWTKVVAVDTSGNASSASVGASATAALIDTAHISDLTVSKVTAGTIGATWIVGGTIATATSGARVELVGAGFNAYNSGGTKTVEIKGSDGSATITGQFRTGFAGGGVPYLDMVNSGDRTTITFYNAAEDNPGFMNSPQDGAGSSMIGINTGNFSYATAPSNVTSRHRLFLSNASGIFLESFKASGGGAVGGRLQMAGQSATFSIYNNTGDVLNGGQVFIDSSGASVQVKSTGTTTGGNLGVGTGFGRLQVTNSGTEIAAYYGDTSGNLLIVGQFANNKSVANNPNDAIICASGTGLPGAATTYSATYGSTCTTRPGVVYGWYCSTLVAHRLSGFSTTGFSVECASAAAVLQFWAFRNP